MQDASGAPSPTRAAAKKRAMEKANLKTQKLVSLSTAMESIQAQTEPIDEQEHLPYVSFFLTNIDINCVIMSYASLQILS